MARVMVNRHTEKPPQGMPTRQQVLDFIAQCDEPAGKREIARAFGLKGTEKIALKALLKDMAEEGLIDGNRTAFHRMGGVPRVTVLRVIEIDEGDPIAVPDTWQPDDASPAPRLRVIEARGKGGRSATKDGAALRLGDRVLARTEETEHGWDAYPIKKLPAMDDQVLGVVEFDGAGKGWLAPVDKRVRHSVPIADLGGAEVGQLVLAEPAGRSPRAGVKVTTVLGDPLAPRAFSLIAIHKHGIPFVFGQEMLDEAQRAARLPLSEDAREDLTHLPIVAIDPVDAPNPMGRAAITRWSRLPMSAFTCALAARSIAKRGGAAIRSISPTASYRCCPKCSARMSARSRPARRARPWRAI